MMGAKSVLGCISAIIFMAAGLAHPAYAGPVFIYGGDFNLPIPQEPDSSKGWMADAVIDITAHHIIQDLDVEINITHSNVFDLKLLLVSPSGTEICLNDYALYEFFIGENYTDTIFDDEAELYIKEGQAPFTGRFRPKDGLYIFDGEDISGLWRLRIRDKHFYNTGTLDSFYLVVSIPEPATVSFLGFGFVLMAMFRHFRRH